MLLAWITRVLCYSRVYYILRRPTVTFTITDTTTWWNSCRQKRRSTTN